MRTEVPTFLAMSHAPQDEERRQQRVSRAIEVVTAHARTEPHVVRYGSLVAIASDESVRVRSEGGDAYQLSRPPGLVVAADARLPPFALASVDRRAEQIDTVVDECGLRHVYWIQGDDWAAVSTSSSVLASIADVDANEWALATLALCGNLLGSSTPYRSVQKMPAGSRVRMVSGHATLDTTAASPPEQAPLSEQGMAESVRAGVRAISTAVLDTVEGHSGIQLELSGGLDSRMLLAALHGNRSDIRAITLDLPGGTESSVAARLASMAGLEHHIVDMHGIEDLGTDEAGTLVAAASHRRDHSGNPLAAAVLDWAEGQLDQGPRLTGQNGEYCRGFYYPLQFQRGRTTPRAARRLATWRMFTNDGVDASIFAGEFIQEARSRTMAEIVTTLTGFQKPWLEATDEFYLRERMQRWVGLGFSDACMSRPLLAPFFHPAFLRWSAAADPADKRNSRLFSMVLQDLSPDLASVPLSNRPPPATLAESQLTNRVRQLGTTATKAVGKVRQKYSRTGKPPSGTARLASLQLEYWRQRPELLSGIASLEFVDSSAVERIIAGDMALAPASVGFLATLQGVCNVTAGTANNSTL